MCAVGFFFGVVLTLATIMFSLLRPRPADTRPRGATWSDRARMVTCRDSEDESTTCWSW